YRYTFQYKWNAIAVIVFNLSFVIFNLLSFVLFIPFLQLIFEETKLPETLVRPIYEGGFTEFFLYLQDYYNYFMQKMVLQSPDQALLFVCISVFIAFLFKNISRYLAIWYQSQLRMSVVRDVRDALYEKSVRLPLSFYSDARRGDMMSRMNNDVGQIELGVVAVLELFFREPLAIVLHISVLLYWSPTLTYFSFILLPISAFVISRIGKSLKRTSVQEKNQISVLLSTLEETLSGIRIIKAFNGQVQVIKNFKAINLLHQKLATKSFRKGDLSSPLNETLGAAVMLCIAWFGGKMILDASNSGLTGKEFIAFIIVFSQLLRPIQGVANSITLLNRSSASQDRINVILNEDERIIEVEYPIKLGELKTGIEFKNVSFRYGDEWVLQDINFKIPHGQKIALVGESGSGKSTLSDLLPRFYDVVDGEITFDGQDIRTASLLDLRSHIGVVTQESILFNDTVANNISFGMPNATREAIIYAAKIANAHQFVEQLEFGYDTNIGERGNKLSGGQKQRLSIARAVLKNPNILILDEATSALDTESEVLVQEALENLMQNRTSLVIAHRLSTIKNADNILVLSKGRIVETGKHDELMQREGVYYKLCTMQGIMG
ncbi:MAG: ABC transporter ATP-binding protein/permease, partial [Bacteroidetes bacterium]|nr:ABC transporter ATP-binding protein/permease [Bacteroidota bacterium]